MKLKPSKETQDDLSKDPNYAQFMQELIQDFNRLFSTKTLKGSTNQELINFAFVSFCIGCGNSLNERSAFFQALDVVVSEGQTSKQVRH